MYTACSFRSRMHVWHNNIVLHTGTEDGKVYKCSKAYSAHYLDVYEVLIHPLLCWCSLETLQYTSQPKAQVVNAHCSHVNFLTCKLLSVLGSFMNCSDTYCVLECICADTGRTSFAGLSTSSFQPRVAHYYSVKPFVGHLSKHLLTHFSYFLDHITLYFVMDSKC